MKLHQLSIGYGKKILLNKVSIRARPKELICLMGRNGSGKSSLIRVISGLQQALSGNIEYTRKDVSVVLTDQIVTPNMTVKEAVSFGRYPHLDWRLRLSASDEEIIHKTLKKVHIDQLQNRMLSHLSDGQRQLVMVARALAQDTPILLLDEPTAHLDLNHRIEIMRLLHQVAKEENKILMMATHELDLALQMADRIWLIHNLQIHQGVPEDLVLSGLLDDAFQLKGYDLKTGKIHLKKTGKVIGLRGDGAPYLWTKNALERNGFRVVENSSLEIIIQPAPLSCTLTNEDQNTFDRIEHLLLFLNNFNSNTPEDTNLF